MILLFKSAFILAPGVFLLPRRWKGYASLLPILLLVISSTNWAIKAMTLGPQQIDLFKSFWSGDLMLVIDRISAFFILIINLTCVTGIIYSLGYTRHYLDKKGSISISLHFYSFIGLQFAMLLVVMLRDGFAFLVAWELMSLFSFVLVIFEGEKEATLKTGITYLVQMHLGFTLLLIAFLYVSNQTGAFGFDALQIYFLQHNNFWLFLLFFLGFGIKAGFVPLHSWLPHAHPAAPSHVSGVMSGIMIKMGLYGILRVLTHVQSQFLEVGFFVLSMGVITALTGILYAIFQKDVKKTLAYSSIENIGIIGIGIGLAWVGKGLNNELLMTLAMASALLHIFNHALYKSLLFYTAGNVYYSTHSRDLDRLGGLAKTMPVSTMFFMVGAVAISALPPFNGFISEFLLYKSVFENITTSAFDVSLINLAVLVSLVVIGGLSVFAFTKTFGISFLGSRRTPTHHEAREVPAIMRASGFIIIPIMLSVCLFPNFYLPLIFSIANTFTNLNQSELVMNNTLITLNNISMGSLILLVVFICIMGIKKMMQTKLSIAAGPTWGCSYLASDFKHQYTSTSYTHSVRELVGPLVDIQGKPASFEEQEIFPRNRQFSTQMTDLIEEKVISGPVEYVTKELPRAGWAQTGMINHYLVYPLVFLIVIGLLTLIGLM